MMKHGLMKAACGLALLAATTGIGAYDDKVAHAGKHPVQAVQDRETLEQHAARMAWWRQARFGVFIHWGLYAIPAGVWQGKPEAWLGEWIMREENIPVAQYKALAGRFNPTNFDADAWMRLIKQSGAKYVVFTTKHHEGFAMFDSKVDPFNVVDASPYHRDITKALVQAAQHEGLKTGFYYSQDQDWVTPGGAAIGKHYTFGSGDLHWDPAQEGDFSSYIEKKSLPQFRELMENYPGAPDVLWFDTPTSEMTPVLAGEFVKVLNQHPGVIFNNRLGGGYQGDIQTPEQRIPPTGMPGLDWESCMTMNDTWGYKVNDTHFKPAAELIRDLIDIASKGGNFLLNIGPDASGRIPQPEIDRLRAIGAWLAVNGEAIYGTTPAAFSHLDGYFVRSKDERGNPLWHANENWRATAAGHKIYVMVMKWPKDGTLVLPQPKAGVRSAYLLADPGRHNLPLAKAAGTIRIGVPAKPSDPVATVVVLETD